MKFQFDKFKHSAGTLALGLVMPVFLTEHAPFWPKPWVPYAVCAALLVIGWACGMLSQALLVRDVEQVVVEKKIPTIPPLPLLVMLFVALVTLFFACTKPQEAKDAYTIQSKACEVAYPGDVAKEKECVEYVRNKWTEAGAPQADYGITITVTDGGSHE